MPGNKGVGHCSLRIRLWRSSDVCRSEEHTSEPQSPCKLVCRLLLEKKNSHADVARVIRLMLSAVLKSSRTTSVWLLAWRFFFFNDTATTEIYTLSLHDALPISERSEGSMHFSGARKVHGSFASL